MSVRTRPPVDFPGGGPGGWIIVESKSAAIVAGNSGLLDVSGIAIVAGMVFDAARGVL